MGNDWLTAVWGETLEDDIELLLRDLCVGWGYCNHSVSGVDLLRAGGGAVTARALAEATLAAEGDADPTRRSAIERLFVYRYGVKAVSEADYAPGGEGPYLKVPERQAEPEDPILSSARRLISLSAAAGAATIPRLETDEVMGSIRKVRRRVSWALGPQELEAAREDLCILICVHERLTGRCWNSDPESRIRLGLGREPGTLADP